MHRLIAFVLLASLAAAQEKSNACTRLECHREARHPDEKGKCARCGSAEIPKSDSTCAPCGIKAGTCPHCARPEAIDPAEMKTVLEKLASDEFEGRRTGSPGIKKAREYMIGLLKKWELKPAAADFEVAWTPCANIAAIHRGSDEKLKDEVILVVAHYDHLGKDLKGGVNGDEILNGADDNGSGSTALLFIARALAACQVKTKRSILFLWTSGEEQGLNGAKSYCQKPIVPLAQTAALVNCDMIGRPGEKESELYGVGTSKQFAALVATAGERVPEARVKGVEGKGQYFHRTDTNVFWSRGVPSMFLFSGMHSDYHRVTDHADRIDYDRLAGHARYILALAVLLADFDGKIELFK